MKTYGGMEVKLGRRFEVNLQVLYMSSTESQSQNFILYGIFVYTLKYETISSIYKYVLKSK
jgi:hypothetical protein